MKNPAQEKIYAKLHKFQDSTKFRSVDKFIIVHPEKRGFGKVLVSRSFSGMGKLKVFVWDLFGNPVQYAYASGCNYNKLDAAMSNIIFDGHQLQDNGISWQSQIEKLGYKVLS